MDAATNTSSYQHAVAINRGHHDTIVRLQEENLRLRELLAVCPRCDGTGEIHFNAAWPDPRGEESMECPRCYGTGAREDEAA